MNSLRTNTSSLDSERLLNLTSIDLSKTAERLSSGLRINSAVDDPAGLGIAQQITAQIRGDGAATENIQQGVSALQIVDGSLGQISDTLQRMRELAVQGNNTGLSSTESSALDSEYQSLITAIDGIAGASTFNGNTLLDGSFPNGGAFTIQSGAQQTQSVTVSFGTDYRSAALGLTSTDLTSAANAQTAETAVDAAITTVTTGRAGFGATQSELDSLKGALDSANVANNDALSKVQDADVAADTSRLVRDQLLTQAGASALSAANFAPGFLTQLLGGSVGR